MIALGVVPPLVVASCKKDPNWPLTGTTITGKVIDENNLPVEGYGFSYTGIKKNGISGVGTFLENSKTDSKGINTITASIPQDTDKVDFLVNGFSFDDKLNRKNSAFDIFFERNGKYIRYNSPEPNPTPIPRETNLINFQIKKYNNMKTKFTFPSLFSATIMFLLLFNSFYGIFQNDKALKDSLNRLDTTAFKSKAFLNKAFFFKSLIAPLQKKEKDKDGNPILTLTPQQFEMLTNIIEKANLKEKQKPKIIFVFVSVFTNNKGEK